MPNPPASEGGNDRGQLINIGDSDDSETVSRSVSQAAGPTPRAALRPHPFQPLGVVLTRSLETLNPKP